MNTGRARRVARVPNDIDYLLLPPGAEPSVAAHTMPAHLARKPACFRGLWPLSCPRLFQPTSIMCYCVRVVKGETKLSRKKMSDPGNRDRRRGARGALSAGHDDPGRHTRTHAMAAKRAAGAARN